jgi:peptidoglycan hydrolase-like protein with peptidoglycan-binding domain
MKKLTPIAFVLFAPLFAQPSLAQSIGNGQFTPDSPQKIAICLPFVGCTPDLPSVPGLPSVEEVVKGELYKALAQSLGEEAPIVSSADATYPTVEQLPGTGFNTAQAIVNGRKVTLDSSGTALLAAGDYLVPVDVFCMKHNASSPNGQRYVLAPLKGKFAEVIAALNSRSSGKGFNHSQLQILSWNLQAGMKYDDMTPENQAIIDRLIPDHKGKLTKNFLETIESTYNRLAPFAPGMPSSMNSALDRLGDVGRTFGQVRQVQSQLRQYGNDYSALSRLLTSSDRGDGFQAGGETNTPWSKINDRLYGRLVTENNYSGPARLQLRVLPNTNQSSNQSPIVVASSELSGNLFPESIAATPEAVPVNVGQIVADPQTPSIQPLTVSPQPPKKEEEEEDVYTSPYTPELPGIVLKPQDKTFDSCDAAQLALKDQYAATTYWKLSSKWIVTPTVTKLPNGTYQASGKLMYFTEKQFEYIDFPRYIWKVKKQKKKIHETAWKTAVNALMGHEKGHITVANEFADTQSLSEKQMIFSAASESGALAKLEAARAEKLGEATQLLAAKSVEYDEVTQHGRVQSEGPPNFFPGGTNVDFQCP